VELTQRGMDIVGNSGIGGMRTSLAGGISETNCKIISKITASVCRGLWRHVCSDRINTVDPMKFTSLYNSEFEN
jgi:hypothetical protein